LFAAADPVSGIASATYSREQARQKSYKAELARLDLDERLCKLVAVNDVVAAGFPIGAFASALLSHETWLAGLVTASSSQIAVSSVGAHGAQSQQENAISMKLHATGRFKSRTRNHLYRTALMLRR